MSLKRGHKILGVKLQAFVCLGLVHYFSLNHYLFLLCRFALKHLVYCFVMINLF